MDIVKQIQETTPSPLLSLLSSLSLYFTFFLSHSLYSIFSFSQLTNHRDFGFHIYRHPSINIHRDRSIIHIHKDRSINMHRDRSIIHIHKDRSIHIHRDRSIHIHRDRSVNIHRDRSIHKYRDSCINIERFIKATQGPIPIGSKGFLLKRGIEESNRSKLWKKQETDLQKAHQLLPKDLRQLWLSNGTWLQRFLWINFSTKRTFWV